MTEAPSAQKEMLVVAACALVIVAVLLTLKMQADTHRRLQEFDTRLNLSDGRDGYHRVAAERVAEAPAAPPAPGPHPEQEGDPARIHIPRVADPPPGAVVQKDEQ
ncbi:MAG: hypothetical protein ACREF0_11385 [Acetobacteraceae bacterium]